jgi:hypothetical protein
MARNESDPAERERRLRDGRVVSMEPLVGSSRLRQARTGPEFERAVRTFFANQGLVLMPSKSVEIGVGAIKKHHRFDLGSEHPPVLVECKCHVWTRAGNSPSAKLAVWNEAMYYFSCVRGYRKIFVAQRDLLRGTSLAQHYLGRYPHWVPNDVEFWELDADKLVGEKLTPA